MITRKKRNNSRFLCNFIKTGIYECYISGFVIDKIENTPHKDKRERKVLSSNPEIGYIHDFRIITPLELMDYEN